MSRRMTQEEKEDFERRKSAFKLKGIYAAYRGDRYVGEGTLSELAELLGVKRQTLVWARYPSAKKRVEKTEANRKNRSRGGIHLVLLEEH